MRRRLGHSWNHTRVYRTEPAAIEAVAQRLSSVLNEPILSLLWAPATVGNERGTETLQEVTRVITCLSAMPKNSFFFETRDMAHRAIGSIIADFLRLTLTSTLS